MGELTRREMECVLLAGSRLSNSEIAIRLKIAPRTVANYLQSAYEKLEVRDRIRAAERLVIRYPSHPLTVEFQAQRTAAGGALGFVPSGQSQGWFKAFFVRLPPPPRGLIRLVLILLVAVASATVLAGVIAVASGAMARLAVHAPANGS